MAERLGEGGTSFRLWADREAEADVVDDWVEVVSCCCCGIVEGGRGRGMPFGRSCWLMEMIGW